MTEDIVQANLKPQTIERIQDITGRPVTRGLDRMINECFDKLQGQKKGVSMCQNTMEVLQDEKE